MRGSKEQFASHMRLFPTRHEVMMRNLLIAMEVWTEFKEQEVMFGYVADFAHSGYRGVGKANCKPFIIEVDGSSHAVRNKYDNYRDSVFIKNGVRVLRVVHKTLRDNPGQVAEAIRLFLSGEKTTGKVKI